MKINKTPIQDSSPDTYFDIKSRIFSVVRLKPFWPLGTAPELECEQVGEILREKRGQWVSASELISVCELEVYFPDYLSRSIVSKLCRDYGMVVAEKAPAEGEYYRWTGGYEKIVDDRQMTDEMRAEEEDLFRMIVRLQHEKFEWQPEFSQLNGRRLRWLKRKKAYYKRVNRLRDKLRRMNGLRHPDGSWTHCAYSLRVFRD